MSQLAKDVMTKDVKIVKPGDSVKDAAKYFVDNDIGGAPVLDDDGRLVGLITESDLISQDAKVHFPTYIHLLDSYIFFESTKRFEESLKRAAAATVEELMKKDVVTVAPDASIEEISTLMMDKRIGRIPVVLEDEVVGIITKGDIVRSLSN